MVKFICGARGTGKMLALKEHCEQLKQKYENLKQDVKKASYKLSVTCNEDTRKKYDEAINALIAFEKEYSEFIEKYCNGDNV